MYRLAWATDIHLDLLRLPEAPTFFGEYITTETECDAVLLTGDLSLAPVLERHLEAFELGLKRPVYFVLGNHDYYNGSFEESQTIAETYDGHLSEKVVSLTSQVALVGQEGWYDAWLGNPYNLSFNMEDWLAVRELRQVVLASTPSRRILEKHSLFTRQEIIRFCRERSVAQAALAKSSLEAALKQHERVVLATHFPPFEGATWHKGETGSPSWLPWFSSKHMGDMLLEVARQHPDRKILVLCGHTHSSGIFTPLPNLKVLTGEAVYGAPDLAGILEIEGADIFVKLKLNKTWVSMNPF